MTSTTNSRVTRITALLTLIVVSLLVFRTSTAAFTASTDTASNSWEAGTLALANDASGTAAFTATKMVPGESLTKCVEVTYSGEADPDIVKLYTTASAPAGPLAATDLPNALEIQVTAGAVPGGYTGTDADCTAFTGTSVFANDTLPNFTAQTTYATGVGSWDPAAGDVTAETQLYKFVVAFPSTGTDAGDNVFQGKTASATFSWSTKAGS